MLLTPEARGAIASVLVEGAQATSIVESLFFAANGRPLALQSLGRIVLGRWRSRESGEELIVCRRDSRRIEIHCHGGQAAAAAIIGALVSAGCQPIDWREWTVSGAADPIAAAALVELSSAATERAAAILLDQSNGALSAALDQAVHHLDDNDKLAARRVLDRLLALAPLGCHLTQPWRVVIAGPPNAGKSTLINALLGYRRAIVHQTPGTTRDVVTGQAAFDGWPVELADTAGLRASADELETQGIRLAESRMQQADLVVLVFDGSVARSAEDWRLMSDWPSAIVVYNKHDLPSHESAASDRETIFTSALHDEGIDELGRTISRRLVPLVPSPGEGVPFTAVQARRLAEIRDFIDADRVAMARQRLVDRQPWREPC